MEITFGPVKNKRYILERGLPWSVEDDRKDYGEARIRSLGMRDGRLHALVFTRRATHFA
jgi:uncharacterized protein